MATVAEALDNMLEDTTYRGGGQYKEKSSRVKHNERSILVKQLLLFLENVDEDLSVMEVRQSLEDIT
jgi:hypothetical protein